MRPTSAIWILFLATLHASAPAARAQSDSRPEPNGTVTGRVFCGDTGRPSRFARVSLLPVPNPARAKSNARSAAAPAPGDGTTTVSVDTALDGSYTLKHVAPGAYYVIAKMDGYINPYIMFANHQLDDPTDAIRALIEQTAPRIQVEQDSTAHADVEVERGAAISGTISYDDGAPAIGVSILLRQKDRNSNWVPVSGGGVYNPGGVTNDRGSFRLPSLLPGTYLLEANLYLGEETTFANGGISSSMRSSRFSLSFYGDGTPHMDEASSFTMHTGEERTGQDMTLPISKLHRLTGRVSAGSSGHFVNAATVELIYGQNKQALARSSIDREDGLFHFDFVPEGDYTLRVTNARDVVWEPGPPPPPGMMTPPHAGDKERVLETYGDIDMPLLLRGDMTGITVTVPAKRNNTSATSK